MPHPGGSVHSRKSQDASYSRISSQHPCWPAVTWGNTLTHSGREPAA